MPLEVRGCPFLTEGPRSPQHREEWRGEDRREEETSRRGLGAIYTFNSPREAAAGTLLQGTRGWPSLWSVWAEGVRLPIQAHFLRSICSTAGKTATPLTYLASIKFIFK